LPIVGVPLGDKAELGDVLDALLAQLTAAGSLAVEEAAWRHRLDAAEWAADEKPRILAAGPTVTTGSLAIRHKGLDYWAEITVGCGDPRLEWQTVFAADGGVPVAAILASCDPVGSFTRATTDTQEGRSDRFSTQEVTLHTLNAIAECLRAAPAKGRGHDRADRNRRYAAKARRERK
jgi:hypothetical protein